LLPTSYRPKRSPTRWPTGRLRRGQLPDLDLGRGSPPGRGRAAAPGAGHGSLRARAGAHLFCACSRTCARIARRSRWALRV
jgi:hypothetical protein